MGVLVSLYSKKNGEIFKFLSKYYEEKNFESSNMLEWKKEFQNPIEIADIIGVFIENKDEYKINMWVSLDEDVLINVTDHNADKIIRYLYERYPY